MLNSKWKDFYLASFVRIKQDLLVLRLGFEPDLPPGTPEKIRGNYCFSNAVKSDKFHTFLWRPDGYAVAMETYFPLSNFFHLYLLIRIGVLCVTIERKKRQDRKMKLDKKLILASFSKARREPEPEKVGHAINKRKCPSTWNHSGLYRLFWTSSIFFHWLNEINTENTET